MEEFTDRFVMRLMTCFFIIGMCVTNSTRASEASLMSQYKTMIPQLSESPFRAPVWVSSHMEDGHLEGDVYALLATSYETTANALDRVDVWCDLLQLDMIVKGCVYENTPHTSMTVYLGDVGYQPMSEAHHIKYSFKVEVSKKGYTRLHLDTEKGPLGTANYNIVVEMMSVDAGTFFKAHVDLDTSWSTRLALSAYFATLGRNKVGFSHSDEGKDEDTAYIGGLQGLIERSAMRQFLSLKAYFSTRNVAVQERYMARLAAWHDGTLEYERQLYEMDRESYIRIKQHERQGQMRRQAELTGTKILVAQSGSVE